MPFDCATIFNANKLAAAVCLSRTRNNPPIITAVCGIIYFGAAGVMPCFRALLARFVQGVAKVITLRRSAIIALFSARWFCWHYTICGGAVIIAKVYRDGGTSVDAPVFKNAVLVKRDRRITVFGFIYFGCWLIVRHYRIGAPLAK